MSKKTRLHSSKTKKVLVEKSKEDKRKDEIDKYLQLVDEIRGTKNNKKINRAFNELLAMLNSKIQQVVYKTKIPGYGTSDIYQEALFALRYKAIKDYDQTKSTKMKVSAFDSFAILCVKRHLSTKLKSSWQSKNKTMTTAISINQDRKGSSNSDENVNLEDVLTKNKTDVVSALRKKEDYGILVNSLKNEMSLLEKKVLECYSKNMSYHEIAKKVYEKNVVSKTDTKSIDNSLSRIKAKAKIIYKNWIEENK